MPNAFVRKLIAYAPLGDGDVRLLVEATGSPRRFAAHHDLICEGDQPRAVFVVLEGWACRYKILPGGARQITAFLMPGDFGDIHVGSLEEMDHNIGTLTDCEVAAIPQGHMDALIVATPDLTRAFWRAQLVDQSVLRSWIVSMGRRDAAQRVAHLMLEIYIRMRNVGLASAETCQMPLTQVVIADALGLTPVHINRILRDFRERSVMELRSGKLTITSIRDLVGVAEFDDGYLHRRIAQPSAGTATGLGAAG